MLSSASCSSAAGRRNDLYTRFFVVLSGLERVTLMGLVFLVFFTMSCISTRDLFMARARSCCTRRSGVDVGTTYVSSRLAAHT